jgi:paraquat-inducible protein B
MSKQASPTLIGSFVLGAIGLLVVFVLIIVGDAFNRETTRYVVYFDESIKGLSVGSNVMFRGVPIGFVAEIEAFIDTSTLEFRVPVYIDLIQGRIQETQSSETRQQISEEVFFDNILKRGFRASLAPESLLTGQLYIEMDFFPDEPLVLRGENEVYREIPSVRTGIQAVLQNFQNMLSEIQEEVDFRKLSRDVQEILDGVNRIVNNPETQELTPEMRAAFSSVRVAADRADSVLADVEAGAGPAVESLGNSLNNLEQLIASIEAQVSSDSAAAYQVSNTLQELQGAARAVRILAEYLEQHPEAIVQGKPDGE